MDYFDIPNCALYTGDNVETIRREMQDDFIDLTVTGPPYDNLRTYNGFTWDFKTLANELFRITTPGGVVVWIVADATINGSETLSGSRQAIYFADECGFNLHDTMVWNKGSASSAGRSSRYESVFETMYVFSKGKPKTFNPIKDKPNKCAGDVIHGTVRNYDGTTRRKVCKGKVVQPYGVRHNVWNITPEKCSRKFDHPAMFPETLVEDHIISWSNISDVVFDPFLGSGTTGKMALLNSRKFIGIDISQEYVDSSAKRIKELFAYPLYEECEAVSA